VPSWAGEGQGALGAQDTGGKGEGLLSSVPVQIHLLALLRGANMALLCPRARGHLAASRQLVPRTMWGDGAAVPCCAGSAPVLSPRPPADVRGEATGGCGVTLLGLGHTSCLHQPAAAGALPGHLFQHQGASPSCLHRQGAARKCSRAAHTGWVLHCQSEDSIPPSLCNFCHEKFLHREAGRARGTSSIMGTWRAAPGHSYCQGRAQVPLCQVPGSHGLPVRLGCY